MRKQTLNLVLQNLNWSVNYNSYHDVEKYHLSISVANIWRFLVRIVTDFSCSNSFLKDEILPRITDASTSHVSD